MSGSRTSTYLLAQESDFGIIEEHQGRIGVMSCSPTRHGRCLIPYLSCGCIFRKVLYHKGEAVFIGRGIEHSVLSYMT